jgi:glucose/mannose-6-phosphate isomerase
MIHERDAQDALGIAAKQYMQLNYQFEVVPRIEAGAINNVVYAGMGGSALAATLATTCLSISVPFEVIRDYTLPGYVGTETLVIVASYSGNTEEAMSALGAAVQKGAKIAVIAGGGLLEQAAQEKNYPFVLLPKAEQPRYAALYNLKALATILDLAQITEGATAKLEAAAEFLQNAVGSWQADEAASRNPAKQLAQDLVGSSMVVYASNLFSPVAYKWKISFNENAKNVAWQGTYPEFNHNEFMGWTSHPIDKPYKVIDLRSSLDHPQTQKRFEISDQMLSGKRPAAHVVQLQGNNVLEQTLWGVAFGDFVTLYVGLLNGVNPTPVKLIEEFKKRLN